MSAQAPLRAPSLAAIGGGPDPAALEAEYAADRWDATRLGVPAARGREHARFDAIAQPWLKEATKQWCRWRLATGCAWGTIAASSLAISRFSGFLAAYAPDAPGAQILSRALIERYISWLSATGLAANTRVLSVVCLRAFLEHNRRHRWLQAIPPDAAVYREDVPRRDTPAPRFVSEFVMAQLESDEHLATLKPTLRHLVIVIMETGLRAGDACTLPYSPLVDDSVGWPCLRFHSFKVHTDCLVPLSGRAAVAIRDQQAHVRATWSEASPWLLPEPRRNPDGAHPISYHTLQRALRAWQARIGLHDEAGQPVSVSAHQFRHTYGTRLINAGVPQHIVQKVLGHVSPAMTAMYARLHDTTIRIREAFDRYQRQRVDIAGRLLEFDPEAPTAEAEWVKHNLARIQASLPNGYCGRPPKQDCPHPNACLTCPDFRTTIEFLPVHRAQAENNRILIARAEESGQIRLAQNHRRVQESLERIIPALEALGRRGCEDG